MGDFDGGYDNNQPYYDDNQNTNVYHAGDRDEDRGPRVEDVTDSDRSHDLAAFPAGAVSVYGGDNDGADDNAKDVASSVGNGQLVESKPLGPFHLISPRWVETFGTPTVPFEVDEWGMAYNAHVPLGFSDTKPMHYLQAMPYAHMFYLGAEMSTNKKGGMTLSPLWTKGGATPMINLFDPDSEEDESVRAPYGMCRGGSKEKPSTGPDDRQNMDVVMRQGQMEFVSRYEKSILLAASLRYQDFFPRLKSKGPNGSKIGDAEIDISVRTMFRSLFSYDDAGKYAPTVRTKVVTMESGGKLTKVVEKADDSWNLRPVNAAVLAAKGTRSYLTVQLGPLWWMNGAFGASLVCTVAIRLPATSSTVDIGSIVGSKGTRVQLLDPEPGVQLAYNPSSGLDDGAKNGGPPPYDDGYGNGGGNQGDGDGNYNNNNNNNGGGNGYNNNNNNGNGGQDRNNYSDQQYQNQGQGQRAPQRNNNNNNNNNNGRGNGGGRNDNGHGPQQNNYNGPNQGNQNQNQNRGLPSLAQGNGNNNQGYGQHDNPPGNNKRREPDGGFQQQQQQRQGPPHNQHPQASRQEGSPRQGQGQGQVQGQGKDQANYGPY